jgi:hypothetical protein
MRRLGMQRVKARSDKRPPIVKRLSETVQNTPEKAVSDGHAQRVIHRKNVAAGSDFS